MTVQELLKSHPDWPAVRAIYHTLVAHGYKAFLAGGCVRDALRGEIAKDLDLATDARPEQVEEIFEKTIAVGKSFGVIRVLHDGADVEVASFRIDGNYEDGRRPDSVQWATAEEDAKRRDFTVNAMFWDLESEVVVDYVRGLEDLQKKLLKAVGDPYKRFAEDHLRLLRAVRFAGQLRFQIEEQTFLALQKESPSIVTVSGERLREEMTKLLLSPGVGEALDLLFQSGLQTQIFPHKMRRSSESFYEGTAKKASPGDAEMPAVKNAQEDFAGTKIFSESWQAWVHFFEDSSEADVEKSLQSLKFSNKETTAILQALGVLQRPSLYLDLRRGRQLELLPQIGYRYALKVLLEREPLKAEPIAQQWQSLRGELPAPFLRGEDVKSDMKGPAIKECLNLAYWEQLEGTLASREEALQWYQIYLRKNLQGKA